MPFLQVACSEICHCCGCKIASAGCQRKAIVEDSVSEGDEGLVDGSDDDAVVDETKLRAQYAYVGVKKLERELQVAVEKKRKLMALYVYAAKQLYDLRRNIPMWYDLLIEDVVRPDGVIHIRSQRAQLLLASLLVEAILVLQGLLVQVVQQEMKLLLELRQVVALVVQQGPPV